jgi:hypothetical protein
MRFVQIITSFTVPEGKMDEFKASWPEWYDERKQTAMYSRKCLYYGFTVEGNTVHCREGYKNADGVPRISVIIYFSMDLYF